MRQSREDAGLSILVLICAASLGLLIGACVVLL